MFFLKKFKPRTPGTRNRISRVYFEFLKIQKHHFFMKKRYHQSGRNNTGRITTRHKSSYAKNKKIIWVDYLRIKFALISVVLGIFLQKYNMCFFGLVKYSSGGYCYIPLPENIIIGQFINESTYISKNFNLDLGSLCFFLSPHTTFKFFNICHIINKKSIYARSAGSFCIFISKNIERNILKIILPSKKFKKLTLDYFATTGRASNVYSYKIRLTKAGQNRYLGKRPTVRGVAMNAFDHPNGGRTKTNTPEKTPWGKVAKKSK